MKPSAIHVFDVSDPQMDAPIPAEFDIRMPECARLNGDDDDDVPVVQIDVVNFKAARTREQMVFRVFVPLEVCMANSGSEQGANREWLRAFMVRQRLFPNRSSIDVATKDVERLALAIDSSNTKSCAIY